MHQNDVPVVHHLRIGNATGEALSGVTVRVSTDPPFATTWERVLTRVDPGQTYDLGTVDLLLEHAYLSALPERVRGSIGVEVTRNGDVLARHAEPISVLAHDEWGGADGIPEILAAFVTPNDAAVEGLLRDASQLLAEGTGDSSLSGYQSKDPQRVLAATLRRASCRPSRGMSMSGSHARASCASGLSGSGSARRPSAPGSGRSCSRWSRGRLPRAV